MKIYLLSIAAFLFCGLADAQDSLTIKHNGKTIYRNIATEDSIKNTIVLNKGELKEDYLLLTFNPRERPGGTTRTISVNDKSDRVLFQKESNGISIPGVVLRQWSKQMNAVKIYTWATPNDPRIKASVRIRRVLLCTLLFQ